MGSNKSKLSYINQAANDLEKDIRTFECSELLNANNAQKEKSFKSVYSQICFDSEIFQGENERNLKAFLDENFNPLISKLVTNSRYFRLKEGRSEFDMKKIRLLIFLLTFNTNDFSNSKVNPDKGIFFLSLIRDESSENMSEAIKVDEVDLLALLEIIYNIACIEIPTFFMEEKNKAILKEKIVSFEKSKDAIIIGILDELAGFYPKNAKEGDKKNLAISPDALLELFRKDPRFFTAGHIRAIGWNIFDHDNQTKNDGCCIVF